MWLIDSYLSRQVLAPGVILFGTLEKVAAWGRRDDRLPVRRRRCRPGAQAPGGRGRPAAAADSNRADRAACAASGSAGPARGTAGGRRGDRRGVGAGAVGAGPALSRAVPGGISPDGSRRRSGVIRSTA